jgi:cob(I)alamin adenosyltransferase
MVKFLEEKIDSFENELSPITNFILPGGNLVASWIHISRAITRRAETKVITLSEKEKINNFCAVYLNRLSDLLFVIARTINKRNRINDIIWKP